MTEQTNPVGGAGEIVATRSVGDDWTACPFCSADHDFIPPCDEAETLADLLRAAGFEVVYRVVRTGASPREGR